MFQHTAQVQVGFEDPDLEGFRLEVADSATRLRALRAALKKITNAEIDEFRRCFTVRRISVLPKQMGVWAAVNTPGYCDKIEEIQEALKKQKTQAWECIVGLIQKEAFTSSFEDLCTGAYPASHLDKENIDYLKSLDKLFFYEDTPDTERFRSQFFKTSAELNAEENNKIFSTGGKVGIGGGTAGVGILMSAAAAFIIQQTGTITLGSGLPGAVGLTLLAIGIYFLVTAYQETQEFNRQYRLSSSSA